MEIAKRRLFVLSMLLALAMSLTFSAIRLNYAQPTLIYLDGPPEVIEGEDFTVSVIVNDVVNLWGWQILLQWDPAMIEIVNVVEGDFLREGGATVTSALDYRDSRGWLLSGVYLQNTTAYVDGSGTLVAVTLRCTGPGLSYLNLNWTRLFSPPVSVPWNGYGDANASGNINMLDTVIVATAYGSFLGDPKYNPQADFDSNGLVGLFDLLGPVLNFMKQFGDSELVPVDIGHSASGGVIYQIPAFPVTWRWVNGSSGLDVWYIAYISFEFINTGVPSVVENFSYTQPLDYVSFDISSTDYQYCTVTIPKLFMSGAPTRPRQLPRPLPVNMEQDSHFCSLPVWTRSLSL